MRVKPSGPSPCEVMIIGEAPGKDEDIFGKPFWGSSGAELRRMLLQAGFKGGLNSRGYPDDSNQYYLTNVFMDRPPNNDLDALCGKRADVAKSYPLPALSQGKYILEKHLHELDRLRQEIIEVAPRLILAVGNTPCWALLQRTGVGKLRGALYPCELGGLNVPVLPTYHPAAVLRDWSLRVIAVQDFIRARRYLDEGFQQIKRRLILEPDIDEVESFCRGLLDDPPGLLSFDIETFAGTITCIGFAPSISSAITIPFYDPSKPDRNYWPTLELELRARAAVRSVLESPIPKLGQNGLYDIQYCWREMFRVQNYAEDTMIRHHSLYPELPKGLGFMATIYTDEAPWKVLRDRNKDNLKIDDE